MSTTPTSSVINSFQKSELKITTLSDEMCHVGSQLSQFFWIAQPATVEIVGKSGSFKTAILCSLIADHLLAFPKSRVFFLGVDFPVRLLKEIISLLLMKISTSIQSQNDQELSDLLNRVIYLPCFTQLELINCIEEIADILINLYKQQENKNIEKEQEKVKETKSSPEVDWDTQETQKQISRIQDNILLYENINQQQEFIQQLGFVCVDGIDGFLERGVVEGFDNRTSSLYQVSQALNILASHSFCRVVITNHTVEDNKRAKVQKRDTTQKRIGESYNIDRFSFQEKDIQTQKNENDENDQDTINDGQFNTLLLRNKLGVLWEGAVQERITILNAQTTQRNFPITKSIFSSQQIEITCILTRSQFRQVPLVGKFMLDYPCY